MSYKIYYSDKTKDYIEVNDSDFNTETSLTLPGRNQRGYGVAVGENFLHLLENFANSTAPDNPVEGQMWYDTTQGVEELKVYDGTQWKSSGSVKKTASTPASAILGDLWVDTDNQQLFLFNGATWTLVGPTFSSGLRSGVVAETVIDINDIQRVILKTYVQDQVVSIYSSTTFIPKLAISGFTEIKVGQNISSTITSSNVTYTPKLWGVSEKAESLIVGSTVVSSSNFLRKDTSNITNFGFTVRNDQGISTGGEAQLRMSIDGTTGSIYHSTSDSQFDIRVNYQGEVTTLIRATSSGRIGIGINNLNPSYTLDVDGTTRFTDIVLVESTSNTTDAEGAALQIAGGTRVAKNLNVIGQTNIRKGLTIGSYNSELTTDIFTRSAITPLATNTFDIGTSDNKFRYMYATKFYGNIEGDVTGNISGTANTASKLSQGTTFRITGDVETDEDLTFDGSTGGSLKIFETRISSAFIDDQTEFTDVNGSDEFLVFRAQSGQLGKMYRTTLFQQIATIPTGTILPFAGSVVPLGYLLCDGSEKSQATYAELFAVIGYTYGAPNDPIYPLQGQNTFRLPDLRGRFPLGRNTMDNADSVTSPSGPIDSSTKTLNPSIQASQSTAGIIGNSSGNPEKTLLIDNVPDHVHELTDSLNNEFYTIANRSGTPTDQNASTEQGLSAATESQLYDRTGGIFNRTVDPAAFDVMNPYLTINYIIFTGKFS